MTSSDWLIRTTKVRPLRATLIQPFRTALGDHDRLDNILFSLQLKGSAGYNGEAAVAGHITGESLKRTRENLSEAGEWLLGRDIREYLAISAELHERYAKNPSMIAAVETAVMDAFTSRMDIPLWRWFGPRCRKLKTDITIVIADLAETQESVRRFYRQGFRQFKVKIGRDFELDIKRMAAVAKLAPKGTIIVDANQGFSAAQILKFLQALQKRGIRPALLEQPVPREDREGLIKVARSTDIPVCADESVRSLPEAAMLIRQKAVQVINIKLMKFGLIHAAEIARLARASGMGLMIGGMLESSLAMTASAHLAAGLGGFSYIDLDTPFFIRGEAQRNPYLSARGLYDLRGVERGIGIIPIREISP